MDQYSRKVIFINCSFHSFCKYQDSVFEKLYFFFDSFKPNKDYLLWWRPHPKLEDDLEQYDINLYNKYIKLKKYYIEEKIGIFDTEFPFEHAIDIADIYYGDGGTVVEEFIKRDKQIIYPNYTGLFFPMGISKWNNYIYGTDHDTSGIVRYSVLEKMWEYVGPITQTCGMAKAYHNSFVTGNSVIYIPYKTKNLVKYDIEENIISYIDLNLNENKLGKECTYFFGFYFYNNILYLIPAGYSSIISVNFITYEVTELFDISDMNDKNQAITWLSWNEIKPGVLAMASMQKNQVLIIDFFAGKRELFDVGDSNYKFSDIRMKDDALYLVVKNKPVILEWKYKDNKVSEIRFDETKFGEYGKIVFDDYSTCIYNDKLFCFPAKSKSGYSVNLTSKEIKRLTFIDKYIKNDITLSQFDTVTIAEGKVYLQNSQNKFITFDLKKERVVAETELKLTTQDITRIEVDLVKYGRIRNE